MYKEDQIKYIGGFLFGCTYNTNFISIPYHIKLIRQTYLYEYCTEKGREHPEKYNIRNIFKLG